jgi:tRNA1Val (adenine37-N6)-methyltransferase
LNPHPGKLAARHETTAGLTDFLAAAKYLVKPSGRICLIQHVERLADLLAAATAQKLAVVRVRMVHGTLGAEARVFLVELVKGRKNSTLQVLPPLIVRSGEEQYTEELQAMLQGN